MVKFLVAMAVLGWIGGSFLLTQATTGVGVIVVACLFAILARITQAQRQHAELMRTMRGEPEPAPERWSWTR